MAEERRAGDVRTRVALASFFGMAVSAPAVFSINALLLKPMTADFGWGRGTISIALMISSPAMALMYVIVGPLLDRFGVRRIVLPGYFVFGALTAGLSLLDGSVAEYVALRTITTASGAAIAGVAFGKVVSRHFSANRGVMLGLCLGGGGGLGMTVLPLGGAVVLAAYGWRATFLATGLFTILLGATAAVALPRDAHDAGAADRAAAEGVRAGPALRSRSFLILSAAIFLTCVVVNGLAAHLAALATDRGLSPKAAATALSIYAASLTCAQFGVGFLLDRVRSPRLLVPSALITLAGILLIRSGGDRLVLSLGASLIGVGGGSAFGILPYMLTRYFGLRAFSTLYGIVTAGAAVGVGIGAYLMGWAFDRFGSYHEALTVFAGLAGIVALMVTMLPRYAVAAGGTRSVGGTAGIAVPLAEEV